MEQLNLPDRNMKNQHWGLRRAQSCLQCGRKAFHKLRLLVGKSALEWPSFIKHFSSCRQLWGKHRGARLFTPKLSRGLQDRTDGNLTTYSFTQCNMHSLSTDPKHNRLSVKLGFKPTFRWDVQPQGLHYCLWNFTSIIKWKTFNRHCAAQTQANNSLVGAPDRIFHRVVAPPCGEILHCSGILTQPLWTLHICCDICPSWYRDVDWSEAPVRVFFWTLTWQGSVRGLAWLTCRHFYWWLRSLPFYIPQIQVEGESLHSSR